MAGIRIRVTDSPRNTERDAVLNTLRQFTLNRVGLLDNHDFAALLEDSSGDVVGGLIASSRWGGFHIDILALPEVLRGQGFGSRLMAIAEDAARQRCCFHMLLDTYVFQAKTFYEKHGFIVFGQIDGPSPYYPRFFMHKMLASFREP